MKSAFKKIITKGKDLFQESIRLRRKLTFKF